MDLAERFERFGAKECAEESPLYAKLALGVARDPDLLAIAAKGAPGQPPPNLFFAAVHFLLLKIIEEWFAKTCKSSFRSFVSIFTVAPFSDDYWISFG